jgi:hypothetical protein
MKFMGKSITRTRKSRGRPATGAESVHLRVLPDQAAAIDAWIKKQDEPVTRPEAIRRLVEIGLTVKARSKQGSRARSEAANAMASDQLDQLVDQSASTEQQANRKRRLLKGPEEFRSVRVDRVKQK